MIYLCFILPIITCLFLAIFYGKFVIWWELVVPILISTLFILIAKWICISSLTSDTEWLGGYVEEVRYYEDWNEYIHRICHGSCGKNCSYTYDCSYVIYHPEYWTAQTNLGEIDISKSKYEKLVNQFKSNIEFNDLHRHYFSNDGDMYSCNWKGENETLDPVVIPHVYENRPKAALNVYHYEPIDTADIKQYKLFEYPNINGQWNQRLILGYKDKKAERQLQILNARLGKLKQIRVFICIFKDQTREAGELQEQYWQGSNKNEFIITIGIDSNNKIQWCHDFSWTEKEDMKVDLRTFVEAQDSLDLSGIVNYTYNEIATKWVRRDFKEFDYLSIEPTMKQTIWILILTLSLNIGIGIWIVKNEIE